MSADQSKPGRNDPCPCGSGRKYKHCCLAASTRAADSSGIDLAWQRHRRVYDAFPARMHGFINDTYGPLAIEEAWEEFLLWVDDAEPFDAATPHLQIFMPWFFHVWAPDPHDTVVEDESLHDCPPTHAFLVRQGRRLDPTLRRFREASLEAPFTFYELTACTPGTGFSATCILTGAQYEVQERSASRSLAVGDVLFAQLVRVDPVTILEAAPPCPLKQIDKLPVIELRKKMRAQGDPAATPLLRDWDMELRAIYLDATESILSPQMPELRNTDGDPLVPHKLSFDIDGSVQATFDALRHLALPEPDEDVEEEAERDAQGELQRVRFSWLRRNNARQRRNFNGFETTVLGHVTISPGRLTCEVNSVKRAAAFRRLIAKLPASAGMRFRAATVESIERALEQAQCAAGGATSGRSSPSSSMSSSSSLSEPDSAASQDELLESPGIRAQLNAMLARHYESWPTEKLPALGNRTPLVAVRDPDGRDMVEALLRDIERDGGHMQPPLDPAITQRSRKRLGL